MKTNTIITTFIIIFFNICFVGYSQKNDSTKTIPNGTIVSSENATVKEEFKISSKTYDETMVGVYFTNSKAEENKTIFKILPVITSGITYAMCNSQNGAIKKGDYITTSSEAGVGMKATQTGMVLGVALEDATSTSGLVKIRVLIQYVKQ